MTLSLKTKDPITLNLRYLNYGNLKNNRNKQSSSTARITKTKSIYFKVHTMVKYLLSYFRFTKFRRRHMSKHAR